MTKILLDTNAYSGFMSGNKLVFDYIIEAEEIYMSTVMIGELFAGFIGGKRYIQNREDLKIFLQKEGVKILNVSIETAEIFGELKAELSRKGKMIPLNDIWIASHAIETGSKIVTFDSHFKHISGLRIWELLYQDARGSRSQTANIKPLSAVCALLPGRAGWQEKKCGVPALFVSARTPIPGPVAHTGLAGLWCILLKKRG